MYAIETTLLRRETARGSQEQFKQLRKNSKRDPGEKCRSREARYLEEGAEAARPPRILDLEAGPAGFSAIFSGGGGGEMGGARSRLAGWWTGSLAERRGPVDGRVLELRCYYFCLVVDPGHGCLVYWWPSWGIFIKFSGFYFQLRINALHCSPVNIQHSTWKNIQHPKTNVSATRQPHILFL